MKKQPSTPSTKIRLDSLPEEGRDFDLATTGKEIVAEALIPEQPDLATLSGSLHVHKMNEFVQISGNIQVELHPECDRCLEKFSYPHSAKISLNLLPEPEVKTGGEKELRRDDLDMCYYQGQELDLAEAITDALVLSLPEYLHCKPDCKGLCMSCGCNLNREICAC